MLKRIYLPLTLSLLFVSLSAYSLPSLMSLFIASKHPNCPGALPTTHPNFCASFKTSAICYCAASGLPSFMCQNMTTLYSRMLSVFGTVVRACNYQKDAPAQDCLDSWNCYRLGGKNSVGGLCSTNGRACQ